MTDPFLNIDSVRVAGETTLVEGTDRYVGPGGSIAVDRLVGAEAIVLRNDGGEQRMRIRDVDLRATPAGGVLIVTLDGAMVGDARGGVIMIERAVFAAAITKAAPPDPSRVAIAAAQAQARGLPAVGVWLDASAVPMFVTAMPEPGVFLRASGPPGGVVLFEVRATQERGADRAALERAMAAVPRPGLQPGAAFGAARVAGSVREVAAMISVDSYARVVWAGALVATPAGTLLVVGGASVGPRDAIGPATVLAHPLIAPLFERVVVEHAMPGPAGLAPSLATSPLPSPPSPPTASPPPWTPSMPPLPTTAPSWMASPGPSTPSGLPPGLTPPGLPSPGLPTGPAEPFMTFSGPPLSLVPPLVSPAADDPPPAPPPPPRAPTPSRELAELKMGGAIGVIEPGFGPDDPRTFPPASVKVAGWPDALSQHARIPRALGALLGLAVGDALGTTHEFARLAAPPFPELATGPLTDIVGQGPFKVAAGQVTDDTQMATAIADLFWKVNMFTSGTLAVRYVAWRGVAFDIGAQTAQAIELIKRSCPPERAGRLVWEERQRTPAGNGSLMRTAVIGALLAGSPDARREAALLDSAITHFDPRCQLACAALDASIAHALTGRPSPQSALRAAREELDAAATLLRARHPELVELIDAAEAALLTDLDAARDDDPDLYGAELHLHEHAGFVRVAFRLAFWELLHAPDYRAGVVDAANRGGDADTNAAIAGALLGAFHGVEGIPPAWIERVLTAPGLAAAEWEYHPRVFLRALAKGFAAERDPRAIAALAPYLAIAHRELAAGGAAVRPDGSVTLATAAFPLRATQAMPLLRDLLEHAARTPGFEHVTADQVVLDGDGKALRVGRIDAPRPRTPDELARLPRALLCAPPELVAGHGAAPAVSATYNACALWLLALHRQGPYALEYERPMGRAIELPAMVPEPVANAVLAALRPEAKTRVPASFVLSMLDAP